MHKRFILSIAIVTVFLIAIASIYARQKSSAVEEETVKGYAFNTKDIAPDVRGNGGHIEMFVELNKDGSIREVKVLSHNETPEYAAGIKESEFLEQFKGKGVDDGFIVGEDVDAITGATISSEAVAEILKTCLERINKKDKVEVQQSGDASEILSELEQKGLEPQEARYYKVIE